MNVFDASALLAFVQGEDSDLVEEALGRGGVCGTANWSEVAQKIAAAGRDWELAKALLSSYDLDLEPVTATDAERAAGLWVRGSGLSLGDRLCLALGHRLAADVLTADTSWGTGQRIRQIR
ncbi:MAG TPA: PIN domain-containing protein [Acidimicrobiales bacterium]|jgi:PIN domain nuclease of toxin-antitoxin system|nr:PIN domain-containing protein [Acidimicrobiales bacterium]